MGKFESQTFSRLLKMGSSVKCHSLLAVTCTHKILSFEFECECELPYSNSDLKSSKIPHSNSHLKSPKIPILNVKLSVESEFLEFSSVSLSVELVFRSCENPGKDRVFLDWSIVKRTFTFLPRNLDHDRGFEVKT
jgi:hypothetical protein